MELYMTTTKYFRVLAGVFSLAVAFSGPVSADDKKQSGIGVLANGQKLLGNQHYPAISYSGHRKVPRSVENTPTVEETKEDMKILAAMGIKLLRTYNTQDFPHSERTLQAIRELKKEDPDFEMYVMLGAWIQCANAYKEGVDHSAEDTEFNQKEIDTAIRLTKEYGDIVKIIAVGNEAMVDWQQHFVPAEIILKYVKVLQEARGDGRIPSETMITSSDNWAALGGDPRYRNESLDELMRQMDFVSLHTYAFHDTFYNPQLIWSSLAHEVDLPRGAQLNRSIQRAVTLQKNQVQAVRNYLKKLGLKKEIHIGETGWASLDNSHYGPEGTCAAFEYTAKLFYDATMKWTRDQGMTCFYFEAFDEPWKSEGTDGSEGHFGLITVDGMAKYCLWDLVDIGKFKGLKRAGNPITKTHGGGRKAVLKKMLPPKHHKN